MKYRSISAHTKPVNSRDTKLIFQVPGLIASASDPDNHGEASDHTFRIRLRIGINTHRSNPPSQPVVHHDNVESSLSFGILLPIDKDGMITVPKEPGVGVELDWDLIHDNCVSYKELTL
jgi:hypothetical protein